MNDLDEILDSQDTAAESPARRDAEEAQADTDADIDDLMSLSARSKQMSAPHFPNGVDTTGKSTPVVLNGSSSSLCTFE